MWDDFREFLSSPTSRNYLAVRRGILATDPATRDACRLAELANLIRHEAWDQAEQLVDAMNDAWILSPSYHALAARVLRHLGNRQDAETELFLRTRCLEGLAASGDGSAASPYRCTYPGDAAELMAFLGESTPKQRLAPAPSGFCDVLENTDGRLLWCEAPHVLVSPPKGRSVYSVEALN